MSLFVAGACLCASQLSPGTATVVGEEPRPALMAGGPAPASYGQHAALPFVQHDLSPPKRTSVAVSQRAAEMVEYGFGLAERGAVFSAEAEFISALRLLARAADVVEQSSARTLALTNGLTALDEADDFLRTGDGTSSAPNVAALVAVHATPVLKQSGPHLPEPIVAVQSYHDFVRDQLRVAATDQPEASRALCGLARLQPFLHLSRGTGGVSVTAKSALLYELAIDVDSSNYAAANELAVLLARSGHWERAGRLLEQAVRTSNAPEAWHNLAIVAERTGNTDLARQAHQRFAESAARSDNGDTAPNSSAIRWVQAGDFTENHPVDFPGSPTPATTGSAPDPKKPLPHARRPLDSLIEFMSGRDGSSRSTSNRRGVE